MRKLIVIITLLTVAGWAKAEDYGYLTFQMEDGTKTSINTESLVITFSDGKLIAQNGSSQQTLTLTDLGKMYFSTTSAEGATTAISNTEADDDGEVEVFSLSGISKGTFDNLGKAKTLLRPGAYIVKGRTKSFKIVVK